MEHIIEGILRTVMENRNGPLVADFKVSIKNGETGYTIELREAIPETCAVATYTGNGATLREAMADMTSKFIKKESDSRKDVT